MLEILPQALKEAKRNNQSMEHFLKYILLFKICNGKQHILSTTNSQTVFPLIDILVSDRNANSKIHLC